MSWLTRAKALLRSKNTDPTSLLSSTVFSQLSVRLNKAVSQEWPERYADCLLSRRPLLVSYSRYDDATCVSRGLEIIYGTEIGLLLFLS